MTYKVNETSRKMINESLREFMILDTFASELRLNTIEIICERYQVSKQKATQYLRLYQGLETYDSNEKYCNRCRYSQDRRKEFLDFIFDEYDDRTIDVYIIDLGFRLNNLIINVCCMPSENMAICFNNTNGLLVELIKKIDIQSDSLKQINNIGKIRIIK